MNKSFKQIISSLDKPLLLISIVGFVFGLLTIVTASSRAAVVNYDLSIYYYFYRQLVFIFIGVGVALVILFVDTKKYKKLLPFLFILMIILNIIALRSDELSGSKNWIDFGLFKLQPSELSKPVIIAFLAILFEKYYRKLRTLNLKHYDMILKMLAVAFIIPFLVFLQKDFGTLFILAFIIAMMFFASPILKKEKIKYSFIIILSLLSILAIYTLMGGNILNDARKSRFSSWADPCGSYETGGYQVCNSYIAINDGGLLGLGIGKSKQKYSYIPEPHTDSAFAIIAEEYGVYRTILIFIGYIILLWRILLISSRANTLRGRYMCFGIASYIFAHIFINLGGLFGLIPLTGVPLPFFSYGGSFAFSLITALAIVQRVCIETKTSKIKIKTFK